MMHPVRRVRLASIFLVVPLFVLAVALISPARVQAATFNLFYDDFADGVIGTNNIIGTGTFSYAGPITTGSFALNSLSGVSFNASVLGQAFTTADIATNPSLTGINVFSIGGGQFGMVFTGNGGLPAGGSLDLQNAAGVILTHEPTAGIGIPVGCCGGTGTINLFQELGGPVVAFGDYAATTVPEPNTALLLGSGLIAIALRRRS